MSAVDLIRQYVELYRKRDRDAFAAILKNDFTFTSPYDDHIDKAAHFARCWLGGDTIERFDIEVITGEYDHVFLRYSAKWPDKPAFRNVEFMTLSGARISAVEVYFVSL